MVLVVLLGGATAASACSDAPIDVKPYSCPNPINLKSHGVVTVAVDGAFLKEQHDVEDLNDLDFKVLGVYLLKDCNDYYNYNNEINNRYSLDFDEDATRVVVENVLIKPCCGGTYVDDCTPDLLIKIKDLNYDKGANNGRDLLKGEYYLYINYEVRTSSDTFGTAFDCVRLIKL